MASPAAPDRRAIEATLVAFLTGDLGWDGDAAALVGPAPLRLPDVLDSESLIETAGFLEAQFAIEIDDTEVTWENFGTVASLAALVERKIGLVVES